MIRLTLKYLAWSVALTASFTAIAFGVMALSNWRRARQVPAMGPVSIPAGRFLPGCVKTDDECGADETPAVPVSIAAFKIDRFPVTNAAYKECVEARSCPLPHHPEGLGGFWDALKPVIRVTWNEAANYCAWRGGMLPSEAQWERAARGTNGAIWPWGNDFDPGRLCASMPPQRLEGPCPVDRFPQGMSPDGVSEMAGNVWEWTADRYGPSPDPLAPGPDRSGAGQETKRVLKGGSWRSNERKTLRTSNRNAAPEHFAAYNVGFRCVYP